MQRQGTMGDEASLRPRGGVSAALGRQRSGRNGKRFALKRINWARTLYWTRESEETQIRTGSCVRLIWTWPSCSKTSHPQVSLSISAHLYAHSSWHRRDNARTFINIAINGTCRTNKQNFSAYSFTLDLKKEQTQKWVTRELLFFLFFYNKLLWSPYVSTSCRKQEYFCSCMK